VLTVQQHTVDAAVLESRVEASLKLLLSARRQESNGGIPTTWDDGLAFLLMPALELLELDSVTGRPFACNQLLISTFCAT